MVKNSFFFPKIKIILEQIKILKILIAQILVLLISGPDDIKIRWDLGAKTLRTLEDPWSWSCHMF